MYVKAVAVQQNCKTQYYTYVFNTLITLFGNTKNAKPIGVENASNHSMHYRNS